MLALLATTALVLSASFRQVAPGVDVAPATEMGGDAAWAARVVLLDPAKVHLIVRYDPARPTLAQWRTRFPGALAIVNGSFYSVEGAEVRPTCDMVMEGKRLRGAGCLRQDALFFGAVPRPSDGVGPAQMVSREPPVKAPRFFAPAEFKAEQWIEALKSFPSLVRGGVAGCNGPHYCAEVSRTAALAQLRDGRLLIFASQWPAVRRDVAKWLAGEVGAVDALNLDGGPEATLAVRNEPAEEAIGTLGVGLPIVIIVTAR